MTKEKLDRLFNLAEGLKDSSGGDKRVQNMASVVLSLLNHIDNLNEENIHLMEENEALRFDLEDKKFEEGPRPRTRRERGT